MTPTLAWQKPQNEMEAVIAFHFQRDKSAWTPSNFQCRMIMGGCTEILHTLADISGTLIASDTVFWAKSEEDDIKSMEGR